jgi:hypothetical protein
MQVEQASSKTRPTPPDGGGSTTSAVTTTVAPVSGVSDRFVGYLFLFVLLVFLLYVLPEVVILRQYGFAPVEHIDDLGLHPTLGAILSSAWNEKAQFLNPMNNSLVRFFLVTMVVGVVFDRIKKYAPRQGSVSGEDGNERN